MRILVVGPGALGQVFAANLSNVADVRLLARGPEQAERLNRDGFAILEGGQRQHGRVPTYPGLAPDEWRAGVALVLVKSPQTAAAASACQPLLAPDAPVVTLQNGLGNREALVEVFGEGRVAQGLTYCAATATADGVHLVARGGTAIEPVPAQAERLEQLADRLAASGLPAELSAAIWPSVWRKVALAGSLNPLGALVGQPVGRLIEYPEVRRLLAELIAEAAAVARAEGVELEAGLFKLAVAVCRKSADTLTSMHQDVLKQRPTEIDALSGELSRRAERHGFDAPTHRAMWALVRGLERSWGE